MKVLVFTSLYPNNVSPEHGVFIKERMTEFARRDGCDVRVVAPVPYYPPIKLGRRSIHRKVQATQVIEGVQVYHPRYLMIPKVGMLLHGIMMALSVLPVLRRIRREFDFDLIDGHYVYPDGFAAVVLARMQSKPVVISARGTDITLFPSFAGIQRLIRRTLTRADRIITVSAALKQETVRLGIAEEKITVVPNGVDTAKFFPVPREEARERLDLTGGRIILSVGSLTPNKGALILLEAFAQLRRERPTMDSKLVFVGEGSLRGELTSRIDELGLDGHVRLAGSVPHGDLRFWYAAADVLCLASGREGWPNVLLECMACGTPVVAASIWGVPEVVSSGKVGILTERTATEIARGLAHALSRPCHRDDIVRFAEQHTWDRTAASVHRVFSSVLERRAMG